MAENEMKMKVNMNVTRAVVTFVYIENTELKSEQEIVELPQKRKETVFRRHIEKLKAEKKNCVGYDISSIDVVPIKAEIPVSIIMENRITETSNTENKE